MKWKGPIMPEHEYIHEALRKLAVPIGTLNLDPNNARHHDRRNIDAIKYSLDTFGQRAPLFVQEQSMIVRVGNARLLAARELGWTHMAAIVADEDEVSAMAYALADNRTSELGAWDLDALSEGLSAIGDEFDLLGLGWEQSEYEALLGVGVPNVGSDVDDAEFGMPTPLAPPSVQGEDTRNGRFILVYETDDEKALWMAVLGVDGEKVIYTTSDLED